MEKFKDEQGTNLNRFIITHADGTQETVTLTRDATITQAGTPLNATNMNGIVDEITKQAIPQNAINIEDTNGNDVNLDHYIKNGFWAIQNPTSTIDNIPNGISQWVYLEAQAFANSLNDPIHITQIITEFWYNGTANQYGRKWYRTITYNDSTGWRRLDNEGQNKLLGAFDVDNGTTITRQTGYVNLEDLTYIYEYSQYKAKLPNAISGVNEIVCICSNPNYTVVKDNDLSSNFQLSIDSSGTVCLMDGTQSGTPKGYLQYKLATSYTEPSYDYLQQLVRKDSQEFLLDEFDRSSQLIYGGHKDNNWNYYYKCYLKPNTTYTLSNNIDIGMSKAMIINSNGDILQILFSDVYTNNLKNYTFTTNSEVNGDCELYIQFAREKDVSSGLAMLNKGSYALPYQPYNANKHITNKDAEYLKKSIPSLLGAFDIDNGPLITRQTGYVDLGDLTWTYESATPRFYSSNISLLISAPSATNIKFEGICSKYESMSIDNLYQSTTAKGIACSTNGTISIKDTSIKSVSALKASLKGVYLQYKSSSSTSENNYDYFSQLATKSNLSFLNSLALKSVTDSIVFNNDLNSKFPMKYLSTSTAMNLTKGQIYLLISVSGTSSIYIGGSGQYSFDIAFIVTYPTGGGRIRRITTSYASIPDNSLESLDIKAYSYESIVICQLTL